MTKIAIIMDPIAAITPRKDTSLALALAAQKRGCELFYLQQQQLFIDHNLAMATAQRLTVYDDEQRWFALEPAQKCPLTHFDIILMRKDPPVDQAFITCTHILDLAEQAGVLVANKPQSLRDHNEKLTSLRFPELCPSSLVTSQASDLKHFISEQKDVILKPLNGMGGMQVFRVQANDPNINVIIETLTQCGQRNIIAQVYIPEIKAGDKRILLIDGKPVPYALARMPAEGETRANLASGGTGVGQVLSERDRYIAETVATNMRGKGLYLVGLDVIGDYLTEVNVTSPTCMRELEREFKLDISGQFIETLIEKAST